jgi:pimeloyl-ACP methyl ester carboxylesterase
MMARTKNRTVWPVKLRFEVISMNNRWSFRLFIPLVATLFLCFTFPGAANAQSASNGFVSRDANINGASIHYTTGGSGPAVVLLHGFAETSRMWNPILPVLCAKFTVIAPDLPGFGDSSIPNGEMGMKTAAIQIHDLVRSLGVAKARVVGHDIGLMVAYAYAAQFPSEVEKLVVMDAFLPGVQGWEPIYNDPHYWHFRFNGSTPEALVKGRESTYFAYFWDDLAADKNHSIPEADRTAYLTAYSRPGRMHASWEYFVSWPQAAKDFAQLSQTKLTMPVLSIGGDKSLGEPLAAQIKLVATNVTVVIVKNSGHWILEEQPKQTTDALMKFL